MRNFAKELDAYSGLAILFVVLIHANAYYLLRVLNLSSYAEAGYLLTAIDMVVHVAVPMFIFAAGFKYQISNNEHEKYSVFVKKRLKKVIVPFLIISIFFIALQNLRSFGELSFLTLVVQSFKDFIKIFFGYNPAYQLWYIPMYLIVVLTYPLIRNFIKNSNVRLFVFGSISIAYILLVTYTNLFNGYVYPFSFVYYFVFFELGCYVSKNKLTKPKQWLLYIVYIVIFIIGLLTKDYSFNSVIYNIVLAPFAVWVFYYISIQLKENPLFKTLGKYSFYIFLLHEPIFVRWLSRQINELQLYKGYYITLLIAVFAITLSILVYKLLSKIGLSQIIFAEKKQMQIDKTIHQIKS